MNSRSDHPPAQDATELRYVDLSGQVRRVKVRFGLARQDTGAVVRVRSLFDGDNTEILVQKLVPRDLGSREPESYAVLENETRIAARLLQRYGDPFPYPAELARLVGFDLDVEVPFVLFEPFRGRPVAELTDDLLPDAVRRFEVGLLRGVLAMTAAHVVHGGISPETVRWDGHAVQLTGFGGARSVGETSPGRPGPWAAPGQRTGGYRTTPADDVWGAGAVIYHLVTGLPVPMTGTPRLATRGDALRSLLEGIFDEDAGQRPTVSELLGRMRADHQPPGGHDLVDRSYEVGIQQFNQRLAYKRATWRPPVLVPASPPPPVPRRRWLWGGA